MNPQQERTPSALNRDGNHQIPSSVNMLNLVERRDLERCETEIRKDLGAFVRVGQAMLEIKERKLYREKYSTFEQYCQQSWGYKRHYAYHLLSAAAVCSEMLTMVNISPPENERQVGPLHGLSGEEAAAAWKRAAEVAGSRRITGHMVKNAVQRFVRQRVSGPNRNWIGNCALNPF